MKVAQFSYHDPASLPEALGLLTQLENTRLLAGGQSLLPYLAFRMLAGLSTFYYWWPLSKEQKTGHDDA